MRVIDHPREMRRWALDRRRHASAIALVPTMGALHHGHLALIDEARRHADTVIVSIFVNPRQFDRADDFERYPRPIDDDVAQCRQAGVTAVYAPTPAAMYPPTFETTVVAGSLATRFEGAMRPGHFDGVVTVVTKLLTATAPDVATFGEKDFQQLAVVRRLVDDLDLGVEIVAVATLREPDGLALSSRNRRLDPDARAAAARFPRALAAGCAAWSPGARSTSDIEAAVAGSLADEPLARLEYAAVVDPASLGPVERPGADSRLLAAAWFGDVRLIDNCRLDSPPAP